MRTVLIPEATETPPSSFATRSELKLRDRADRTAGAALDRHAGATVVTVLCLHETVKNSDGYLLIWRPDGDTVSGEQQLAKSSSLQTYTVCRRRPQPPRTMRLPLQHTAGGRRLCQPGAPVQLHGAAPAQDCSAAACRCTVGAREGQHAVWLAAGDATTRGHCRWRRALPIPRAGEERPLP